MNEMKKVPFFCLMAVLIVGVIFSGATSLYTARAVSGLKAETTDKPQEDGVMILGEYEILSTLPISDAYKSGDTSKLDAQQKETLEMASAVLDELITEDMSDYEKELAVYQWMATQLKYDSGVLTVIPTTSEGSDNPYGVLKYRNAVCVGYATTFRLFMQMMDIECMVVHNTELYHSWDLVKLDGEWYHTDVYSDQNSGNYANFNMNDEMCSVDHEWDRTFFPAATGIQYNYAYQNRTPAKDIYQIPTQVKEALDQETGFVFLGFEAITEENAQLVESMLTNIQSYMSEDIAYSDLYFHWNWIHVANSDYVLGIYIDGYSSSAETTYDISPEDQEKLNQALTNAFGSDFDWSASLSADTKDSYDGEGSVTVEAVG